MISVCLILSAKIAVNKGDIVAIRIISYEGSHHCPMSSGCNAESESEDIMDLCHERLSCDFEVFTTDVMTVV